MKRNMLLSAVLILAFVTMACNALTVPVTRIEPDQTDTTVDLQVQAPSSTDQPANLTLNFGAGQLNVKPGTSGNLVDGTATYNVEQLKPVIQEQSNGAILSTGEMEIRGLPSFRGNLHNTWELALGEMPMDLSINAGAYEGSYKLDGLSLNSLTIKDGAASVDLSFGELNPIEMSRLVYQTGASDIELLGLENANFEDMEFTGGAGDYTLEFSGPLQRDANLRIEAGISQVTLTVSADMPVEVNFTGGLSNVDTQGDWTRSGDTYTQEGSGPKLTVSVTMGAGSFNLRSR